jgi:hypothetical protein
VCIIQKRGSAAHFSRSLLQSDKRWKKFRHFHQVRNAENMQTDGHWYLFRSEEANEVMIKRVIVTISKKDMKLPVRSGQTISVTSPELSVLTFMPEDTQNPQSSQNAQNVQHPQRETPRHQGNRRHHNYREQAPRPAEQPAEKTQEPKELSLDDEETEQDRSAAPQRQSRGGGRGKPPKRVIEEWANDIYCE